ncbi:uncharacterized protein LOC129590110 isoform X2 [Paramacrobiotus metropolitanus]|nr:uncharacterized protein LOC129590110 isoform X2 [Paramacrobiotus metropolitanus]
MRWTDQRALRLEASAKRNRLVEAHINRLLKSARHQLFPNSRASVSALKDRELSSALDNAVEIINHRVTTASKLHTTSAMSTGETQRRLRNVQSVSDTSRNWPYKNRPSEKEPPGNPLSIVSAWKPTKPLSVMGIGKRKRSNDNLTDSQIIKKPQSKPLQDLQGSFQPTAADGMNGNPFESVFRHCMHQKDAIKRQLLETDRNELRTDLLTSLKDFSLADPPRDGGHAKQTSFQQYIRKWNNRVKKHIAAPPAPPAQTFTLFDQDPAKAGYFAAKDVTTDFDPAMLQEKAKEKENMYKNMADNSKRILEERTARTNWLRTSLDDTRLTDVQEWLSKRSSGQANWEARKEYTNGPTHFGNGAATVLEDFCGRLAAGSAQNMVSIARIMASRASQEEIRKKFFPKEISAFSVPTFYFATPPWKNLVNANVAQKLYREKHVLQ